jgi:hypothetical protein
MALSISCRRQLAENGLKIYGGEAAGGEMAKYQADEAQSALKANG